MVLCPAQGGIDAARWQAAEMNGQEHVILLGGNDGAVLEAAGAAVPLVLFQLPGKSSQEQIRNSALTFHFNYSELPLLLELGRAIAQQRRIVAAVSFLDRGLLPAALLGEHLGLRGNPVSPVEHSSDKLRFRQVTSELCAADVARLTSETDAVRFLAEIRSPIVVKPRSGSGSRGVTLVDCESAAREAFAVAARLGDGEAIAERFVDGPEFSVETLSEDGRHLILGITRKITTGAPHFVELGHEFPAPIEADEARTLEAMTVRMLDRLGHRHGPAHTEARLTPRGVFLIETQLRPGGDQIWEMVKLVTGISAAQETVANLARSPIPRTPPVANAAAVRFFAYENRSVERVTGLETARALPGIIRVVCKLERGQTLGPVRCSADRQGYVLAAGGSLEEARERLNNAMRSVVIETSAAT